MSWGKITINDAFDFVRNGKSVKQNKEIDGLPITRIETIADRTVDPNRVGYAGLSETGNEQWLLKKGDILFSHINSVDHIGKCAIYEGVPEKLIHGMNLLLLRPSNLLHPKFAYHALSNDVFRSQLLPFVNKAVNQASVSTTNLKSLVIPLPPLAEQKRIAAILDKVDQLRQKRRQAIVLLDSLTQSIFLEMFGDPAFNPKGWPIKQIGDLLDSVNYGTSGKAGSNGEFPILRMGNVTSDGRIDVADLKYIDLNKVERPKYTVRRGDLLFNRTNSAELVGKTAVFDLEEEFAFAGYLVRARTNKEATPEFISAYLNSGYGKALLRGMAKSIVGMANINAKEMQRIEIPVPTIELQRQFSERLVRVKEMRQKFLPLQTKVEALFFSLQHRAFSGQL